MTAKEYEDRIRDIRRQQVKLDKELVAAKTEYRDSLPFKVNDYVCITYDDGDTEDVWICDIEIKTYTGQSVTLYVNGHRKEGSRSNVYKTRYRVSINAVRVINDKLNEI